MRIEKIETIVKSQEPSTKIRTFKRFNFLKGIYLLLSSFFFSLPTYAQCAMCRAALESEGDGVKAEAVNDGIVYLMIIPYLLVAIIGFTIYRMNTKK